MALPLIIPKQGTPAAKPDGTLTREWYVPLSNLPDVIAAVASYGTHDQRVATSPVNDGNLWVENDTGLIYQFQNTGWVLVSGVQRINLTLPHGATTNVDAPTDGAIELVYFLDQDSTGGGLVHWRNGFGYASDDVGQALASKRSTFRFCYDLKAKLYVQAGPQITDMAQ